MFCVNMHRKRDKIALNCPECNYGFLNWIMLWGSSEWGKGMRKSKDGKNLAIHTRSAYTVIPTSANVSIRQFTLDPGRRQAREI